MAHRLSAVVVVLALALPSSVGGPAVRAIAQQTTSRDVAASSSPCQCPVIAPVATNDKPAAGKGFAELSLADLEWAFSNTEAQYNGDWDLAMLALAHQVDPSGALKIWDKPMPTPANARASVSKGTVIDFLLHGPPAKLAPPPVAAPRATAPQIARPSPPASGSPGRLLTLPPAPSITLSLPSAPAIVPSDASRDPHAMSELSAGSGSMAAVLYTIARINKYGEPRFGLRKATLRAARFLADDLAGIPQQLAQHDPNAARINHVGVFARLVLASMLQSQWLWQSSHYVDGLPHVGDRLFIIEHQSSYPDKSVDGDLKVDAYDLANAALDVIFSVDDKGVQEGMLHFFGAHPLDANGQPTLADPNGPESEEFLSLSQSLAHLAAKRASFGGSAAPGSPEDALACKAFATLVALGKRPDASMLRWLMFGRGLTLGSISNDGLHLPPASVCVGCYEVAAAARILAGVQTEGEAKQLADALYGTFSYSRIDEHFGERLPQVATTMIVALIAPLDSKATTPLAMARNVLQYSRGAGLAAFGRLMNEHFNNIASSATAAHQLAGRTRAAGAAATLPSAKSSLTTNAGYADGAGERAQSYADAWNNAKPDIDPKLVEPCAPPMTPPRVMLLARGASSDYVVDKFYQNVPLAVALIFEEPYDKDEYPIAIEGPGGKIQLTARRTNDPTVFYTETFWVGGSK